MGEIVFEYGLLGLGTTGRILAQAMAGKGFSVAAYDTDHEKITGVQAEAFDGRIKGYNDLEKFIGSLKIPRTIFLNVPAVATMDTVISNLVPLLSEDDLLIDCSNSHFTDTDRRIKATKSRGIHYLGAGISCGEDGALAGPVIMVGGDEAAYQRVKATLTAIAANINNRTGLAYTGTGSSGHYVKMVHDGIAYALMQVLSESYHLLKQVGLLNNDELQQVYQAYNETAIRSYLIGITASIFRQKDEISEAWLIDMIRDTAGRHGAGMVVSKNALELQVPLTAIDSAVTQLLLSGMKDQRVKAAQVLSKPDEEVETGSEGLVAIVRDAIHFCMITAYAQGMALLQKGSAEYQYQVNLSAIAALWKDGCIISAGMLGDIETAYTANPQLVNLMVNNVFSHRLNELQHEVRSAIQSAVSAGIPVPVMMASLAYFDSYRSEWLPANLVQAQRDYFGAYSYQRTDTAGDFHTNWEKSS